MAQTKSKHPRARRKPNLRARLILLVLALVAIGAIIFVVVQGRQGVLLNPKQLPFQAVNSYAMTGNGVVYINGTVIYYNDMETGKTNWYNDLALEGIQVAASDSMIVIYTDDSIQVLSPTGMAIGNKIQFNSKVISAVCGLRYFAVLTEDAQGRQSMTIADTQGGTQQEPVALEDDFVFDYSFYGTNDQFWMLSGNMEAPILISTVSLYSAGGQSVTGVIQIQEELISDVVIGSDYLYLAGTTNLFAFESGQEKLRDLIYGWEVLDTNTVDKANYFLIRAEQDAPVVGQTVEARLMTLPKVSNDVSFRLPANCLNAFLYSDKIVAITTNRVYIFDLKGNLLRDYSLEGDFISAEKIVNDRLLLNNGTNMYVAPIR